MWIQAQPSHQRVNWEQTSDDSLSFYRNLSGKNEDSPLEGVERVSFSLKEDLTPPKKTVLKKLGRIFIPILLGAKFVVKNPLTMGCAAVNSARYVANAVKEVFGVSHDQTVMGPARLISVVGIAMRVKNIAYTAFDFLKGTLNEKSDAILSIVSDIGSIGDAVSSFAQGLESVGAVAAKSILWATPLLIVSMGLEVAGIALGLKGIIETCFLARKLFKDKSPKEYTIDDYQDTVNYFEERRVNERTFDRKFFKVDKEKFGERLLDIELEAKRKINSNDPVEKKEGENLIKKTMSALRGRLAARIVSYSLSILAASVCIVGLTILLAVPSLQPLGFALLALGLVLSIGRCGFDFAMDYRFKKALQLDNVSLIPGFFSSKDKKKGKNKRDEEKFNLELENLKNNIKQQKAHKLRKKYHDWTNRLNRIVKGTMARGSDWFRRHKAEPFQGTEAA